MTQAIESKYIKALVSGRVQGVSFRATTQQHALKLGLTGYAKNLADGRVEVLCGGNADAVQKLCDWLHQGPSMAAVERVVIQSVSESTFADKQLMSFTIG